MAPSEEKPGGAGPAPAARPLRADARRNRDRLVAVARAAFTAADPAHPVPLEDIAREAGVGIGTLYRHFPTREALVEAVYATELDLATANAPALLERLPPDEALRAWFDGYARFHAAKHGMIDTLRAGWAAGRTTPPTRERINAAIRMILTAGARAGVLRGDVEADDVTVMLLGILQSSAVPGPPEQTERLLDLTLDALRPR